jgi:hypothetical protein
MSSSVPAIAPETGQPPLWTPWSRLATTMGICGRPGCQDWILPGMPIIRPGPRRAWRHADCRFPNHIRRSEQAA